VTQLSADVDECEWHPNRCLNGCKTVGCYFHPNMGTKAQGIDTDHPITIPVFIERFGCGRYTNPIIPSSKKLILLATHDFKNREERKGLYDQSSWVSGWVTGFLSERKPNWSKVLEEKVRKDTLESFSGFIDAYRREDEDGHDYVSVLALQKHIDWLMETE